MTTGVLLALPGPEEAELVALLDAPGSELQVVRRCADLAEVVAAALAGLGSIAVLTADLPGLDRTVVGQLSAAGVRTATIAPTSDAARCRSLGVAAVLTDTDGPAQWAREVRDLAGDAPPPPTFAVKDEDGAPARAGRLAVVWGPRGAPGRSSIAITVAHELAGRGEVLLVDADTEAPSLTQQLGVLDETAGIAAAARLAGEGRLGADGLAALTRRLTEGPLLLTGLTRADRWRELPAAALDAVWDTARELAPWTVVDVAPGIEDPSPGGLAGAVPRRHQATLSALAAADLVLVVGAAEPVGMHRLVLALQELTESGAVAPHVERVVVVNRLRASVTGSKPEHAVIEALARFAGVTDPVLVPDDRPGFDRAMLRGTTLGAVAPASKARGAVIELADRLAGERRQRRTRRADTRR